MITQWEVARKRAGIGGTTQLTAQWWPWYDFGLDRRIAATAFRPRPAVDAGLLTIGRRSEPLLAWDLQRAYSDWVAVVFQSRGRGIAEILIHAGVVRPDARAIGARVRRRRPSRGTPVLPRDLLAEDWVAAFNARRGKQRPG